MEKGKNKELFRSYETDQIKDNSNLATVEGLYCDSILKLGPMGF